MRAPKNELTKSVDAKEMTMYEEIWGDMHIEKEGDER